MNVSRSLIATLVGVGFTAVALAVDFPANDACNYPDEDWDSDGLNNGDEIASGSGVWTPYSDSDSVIDGKDGWPADGDLSPPRVPDSNYAVIPLRKLIPDCEYGIKIARDGTVLYKTTGARWGLWRNGKKIKEFHPNAYEVLISDDGTQFVEKYITTLEGPHGDSFPPFVDPGALPWGHQERSEVTSINDSGTAVGHGDYRSQGVEISRYIQGNLKWPNGGQPVLFGETYVKNSTSAKVMLPAVYINNWGAIAGGWDLIAADGSGQRHGAAYFGPQSSQGTQLPGTNDALVSDINSAISPWISGFDTDKGVFWAPVEGTWKQKSAYDHPKILRSIVTNLTQVDDRYELFSFNRIVRNGVARFMSELTEEEFVEVSDVASNGLVLGWAGNSQDAAYPALLIPIGLVDSKDAILDNGNDVMVQPKKNADDKSPQTMAWIDPHGAPNKKDPEMPWLVLRVWGVEQMKLKIKWKLKVEYKRPNGRKLNEDKIEIPDAGGWVTEPLDGAIAIYDHSKWKSEIAQKGFFGGDAELTFQLLKADGSAFDQEKKWSFYIGGKNPDDAKTKIFITETAATIQQPMAWFVYAIAKHESKDYNSGNSRYNQFWDTNGRFAKVEHHGGEVLWVNNPGEDPPKGFGMFQVTGTKSDESANIPRKQLWNWQDNVRGGLDIIASKRGIADRYFGRIQRRSAAHKAAYQADPPPNIPVGAHTFSSADAIQIYGYNGTGSYNGRPAAIDIRFPFDPNKPPGLGSTKRWFWNPHNVAGGEPYIKKIERELE